MDMIRVLVGFHRKKVVVLPYLVEPDADGSPAPGANRSQAPGANRSPFTGAFQRRGSWRMGKMQWEQNIVLEPREGDWYPGRQDLDAAWRHLAHNCFGHQNLASHTLEGSRGKEVRLLSNYVVMQIPTTIMRVLLVL